MAAPNIVQQVTSSNEFGNILDLTENAKVILNEGEAWAIGSRSGVPVLADSFSYNVEGNNQLAVTIDSTVFRNYFGISPGYTTYYVFTCTSSRTSTYPYGIWQVAWGNSLIVDIESERQSDNLTLASFGISLNGSALQSNVIRVMVTDSDQQYHNNAKYWSELTHSAQESIENLDISTEIIDEDESPEVEKIRNNDVLVVEQPELFDIIVDNDIFANRVGYLIGDYTFIFNGTNWTLNNQIIILSEYGISNITSAVENDTFIIHYNQHQHFNLKIPRGRTGNTNFVTFYVGTDPNGVDSYSNPTYCQIVMNRPKYLNPDQLNFQVNKETGNLEVIMSTGGINNG